MWACRWVTQATLSIAHHVTLDLRASCGGASLGVSNDTSAVAAVVSALARSRQQQGWWSGQVSSGCDGPTHVLGLADPLSLQSDLTELVQHRQAELAAKHQALQVGASGCFGLMLLAQSVVLSAAPFPHTRP